MLNCLFLLLLHGQGVDDAGDPLPPGAVKRLGSTRWRTVGPATCGLSFSSDGKILYLFGGYEGNMRAMDVASGRVLFPYETPDEQRLISGTLSKDSRWIVAHGYLQSRDENRTILEQGTHWFDAKTGKLMRTWKEKSQSALAIASDGSLVARCVWHGETGEHVHVSSTKTGEEILQWAEGKGNSVLSLHFSADDQKLYVIKYAHETGKAMTLYIVDIKAGKTETQRVLDRTKNITYHGISQVDNLLTYYDQTTRLIRVEELLTGKLRQSLPFTPSKKGAGIAFAKGSSEDGPTLEMAFSPDGSLMAVSESSHSGAGSSSLQFLVYDTRTWKQKHAWSSEQRALGHVAISPDNTTLAIGTFSNAILLFDLVTGRQLNEAVNHNPAGNIRGACFTHDGNRLTLMGHDQVIDLWNTKSWTLEKRWQSPPMLISAAAFSPDGTKLAAGGFSSTVQLWEIPTGKPLNPIKTLNLMVTSLAWLDGGKSIAMGGVGERPLKIFDVKSGDALEQHQVGGSNSAKFSSNGLLWMNYRQLIRTRTGEVLATLTQKDNTTIYQLEYANQAIMTADAKGITRVYERATMQERWQANQQGIVSAFSADGRWLASSLGWDHHSKPTNISVRDALTGQERCQFIGQSGLQCLVFSPDGRFLVSAGSDGTAIVWQLPALRAPSPWSQQEAQKNWEILAGEDAGKAGVAIARFLDTPTESVEYLRKQLPATQEVSAEQIRASITRLADPQFAEREKAYRQLKQLGSLAEPVLKQSVAVPMEAESKRRVEALLNEIQTLQLTASERQALRAVEIAERINTSASIELLKIWSRGATGARLTRLADEIVNPK